MALFGHARLAKGIILVTAAQQFTHRRYVAKIDISLGGTQGIGAQAVGLLFSDFGAEETQQPAWQIKIFHQQPSHLANRNP